VVLEVALVDDKVVDGSGEFLDGGGRVHDQWKHQIVMNKNDERE
jgi:hypothetical protein